MISQGHPECIEYGVSFFADALEEARDIENERTIATAYAVRMRNAKEDNFSEFISSLLGRDNASDEKISEDIQKLKSKF